MISLLGSRKLIAFVAVRDPASARAFYRDTLGLPLVSEDHFALVFDANGIRLRAALFPQMVPAKQTVLGWEVPDIVEAVAGLNRAGVAMTRYPGMPQDEFGIWTAPGGARVAWFTDPDGNVLSLSQHT